MISELQNKHVVNFQMAYFQGKNNRIYNFEISIAYTNNEKNKISRDIPQGKGRVTKIREHILLEACDKFYRDIIKGDFSDWEDLFSKQTEVPSSIIKWVKEFRNVNDFVESCKEIFMDAIGARSDDEALYINNINAENMVLGVDLEDKATVCIFINIKQ